MRNLTRYSLCFAVIAFTWLAAGCASIHSPTACNALEDPEEYTETYDPFESMNRAIFNWNMRSDKAIFEPIAREYKRIMPNPVETGISNFYRNLKEPRNMISSALSGKIDITAESGVRFSINTTVGLLGFIDIADSAGIAYRNYDFGHMLGRWGVGDGPYIVYPFAGSSNLRDSFGSVAHQRTTYVEKRIKKPEQQLFIQVGSFVNTRAGLLPFTDILADQPDQYLFARESYRQNRLNTICNP